MKSNLKIAKTLKAFDLLLEKFVLTTVVLHTKKTQEGQAFIGLTNCLP